MSNVFTGKVNAGNTNGLLSMIDCPSRSLVVMPETKPTKTKIIYKHCTIFVGSHVGHIANKRICALDAALETLMRHIIADYFLLNFRRRKILY